MVESVAPKTSLALIIIVGGLLSVVPALVMWGHPGHDHGAEFQNTAQSAQGVKVDGDVAQRLGLQIQPIETRVLETGLQASAEIVAPPDQSSLVTAPVNGRILELLVKPGDKVQQGQPLAKIVAPQLLDLRVVSQGNQIEAQSTLQQARTELTLARNNYQRQQSIAKAGIEAARQRVESAQERYKRERSLVVSSAEIEAIQREVQLAQDRYDQDRSLAEEGAVTRQQVLVSQAALAKAQSQLVAQQNNAEQQVLDAKSALAEAQGKLTEAQAQPAVLMAAAAVEKAQAELQAAQDQTRLSTENYQGRLRQLNSSANADGVVTVTAPLTGTITDRPASPGETVEEAVTPLLRIVNGDRLWAVAPIYEKDINQVEIGQKVRLTLPSQPERIFSGEVITVGTVVEGENRSIPVTIAVAGTGGELKPKMFADVELLTESSEPVLAIPASALIEQQGQSLVFVKNGDQFQPQDVTIGLRAGDWLEVTQGLFPGDEIVTQGGLQLYAQSLLGGNNEPEESESLSSFPGNDGTVPLWSIPLAMVAIAGVSFGVGRWSQLRSPQLQAGDRFTLRDLDWQDPPEAEAKETITAGQED